MSISIVGVIKHHDDIVKEKRKNRDLCLTGDPDESVKEILSYIDNDEYLISFNPFTNEKIISIAIDEEMINCPHDVFLKLIRDEIYEDVSLSLDKQNNGLVMLNIGIDIDKLKKNKA